MTLPRVEVYVGRFGSGKTEVAINRAIAFARSGPATVVDLDLVDPFFRSRQVRERLVASGVEVVAPLETLEVADLPLYVPEAAQALARPGHVLYDVGGQGCGAIVLRQLRDALVAERAATHLLVNPYRPRTRTLRDIATTARELQDAAGLEFAAVVSNPHLGDETTPEIVLTGHAVVLEAAYALGLPVVLLGVREDLAGQIASQVATTVLPLARFMLEPWQGARR